MRDRWRRCIHHPRASPPAAFRGDLSVQRGRPPSAACCSGRGGFLRGRAPLSPRPVHLLAGRAERRHLQAVTARPPRLPEPSRAFRSVLLAPKNPVGRLRENPRCPLTCPPARCWAPAEPPDSPPPRPPPRSRPSVKEHLRPRGPGCPRILRAPGRRAGPKLQSVPRTRLRP